METAKIEVIIRELGEEMTLPELWVKVYKNGLMWKTRTSVVNEIIKYMEVDILMYLGHYNISNSGTGTTKQRK